jgi:hypothetical protein
MADVQSQEGELISPALQVQPAPPTHSTDAGIPTDAPIAQTMPERSAEPGTNSQRMLRLSRSEGGITNTQLAPWEITFPELCEFLRPRPNVGEKNGSYFVRGPLHDGTSTRADANIASAHLNVLDSDSTVDPKTGEITQGAPPPISVHKTLVNLDIDHVLYTTHSHGQTGKGNRFRVLIPAVVNDGPELEACIAWLIDQLHQSGCYLADVKENKAWSQAWYSPRVARIDSEYLCYTHETGREFDVPAAVDWCQAQNPFTPRQLEEITRESTPRNPESVFAQFNAKYGNPEWMLDILADQEYTLQATSSTNGKTAYRLLSPVSASGNAGIILFQARDNTWRLYSHHNAGDPLSRTGDDVSSSDAWDLFRIFHHDDDQQKALSAWREEQKPQTAVTTCPGVSPAILDIEKAEPLDPAGFPNIIQHGPRKGAPLETIANIRHMLDTYRAQARYDVIGKKDVLCLPGTSGCPDNADNSALAHVTSLAKLNGIPTGQIQPYVCAIADTNQFNPVADYITSKSWDSVDRLEPLYATLTTRDDFPVDLKKALFLRWLISTVAAALMSSGFRSRGVLVLQGPQSIGKTSFFLSLVDDPVLRDQVIKIDHHLDASNKDSVLTAVSHWIVEIGELDSSFKKDVARLKGFITDGTDKVRRPYAKRDSEYPRRTVFCASVNSDNFLVDDTGNTRWWTIPVTQINFSHGIDMQQVWAQVHVIYQSGEQWWLTPDEEALLEEHNRGHRVVNAVRDCLEAELDFDIPDGDWQLKTATEVLKHIGIQNPTTGQARDCGAYLRDKIGEPTRSKGRTRWRVPIKQWAGNY